VDVGAPNGPQTSAMLRSRIGCQLKRSLEPPLPPALAKKRTLDRRQPGPALDGVSSSAMAGERCDRP